MLRTLKYKGVTLVEMLLVLVVISMIILMSVGYLQQRTLNMRMDRTVTQMQQILNASLSYYVSHGYWPDSIACLQGSGSGTIDCSTRYLPAEMNSPFGSPFILVSNTTNTANPAGLVYVYTPIFTTSSQSAGSIANMIAGRLPLSYTSESDNGATLPPANDQSCPVGSASNSCFVVSSVNIPGQNLNNASAVNFAGIYHSGSCVPVPTCPVDARGNTMTPQIIVAPASVAGVNDAPTGSPCTATDTGGCNVNAYPLSSFSAYATPIEAMPMTCNMLGNRACAEDSTGAPLPAGKYWRVCLSATTQKGEVKPTTNPWGQLEGTVMAITRCAIKDEPSGSDFTVWSQ